MSDFEKAPRNAVRECFDEIEQVLGCNFHYAQAIWKNLGMKRFWPAYNNDEFFARSFKYLAALAYVPPQDVEPLLVLLCGSPEFFSSDMIPYVMDYYYPTWVAGEGHYNVHDWNVFDW